MSKSKIIENVCGHVLIDNININDIESYSTIELLSMLRTDFVQKNNENIKNRIKDILSTREHIPTKSEQKAKRIAKAKEQKNY